MVGRDTLVDEEQQAKDELEKALDTKPAKATDEEKIAFKDDFERLMYATFKRLTGVLGISIDKETYEKLIPFTTNVYKSVVKSPTEYKKDKEAAAKKKPGKEDGSEPYDTYVYKLFLGIASASLLTEVQSHIPDYEIDFPLEGCAASFDGFPLSPNTQDQMGINYIACGIATVRDTKNPWQKAGYQSIEDDKLRIKAAWQIVTEGLKKFMSNAPSVQQNLDTKRKYLTEKYGRAPGGTFTQEVLPDGFVPVQMKISKEAAKTPVREAAARGSHLIDGWMKTAHEVARKGAKLSKTSKQMTVTCCYDSVGTPLKVIKGAVPELGNKEVPLGNRGSILRIPMTLREEKDIFAKVDASNMKKLFSKICFRGPRVGYPHEPGYDMKCPYCEFEFLYDPRDPLFPLITKELLDKKPKASQLFELGMQAAEEDRISKDEASLTKIGVTVNEKSFQELLDTMHEHYLVPRVEVPRPTLIENRPSDESPDIPRVTLRLLEILRDISYPPFKAMNVFGKSEYREILEQTIANIAELQKKGSNVQTDYIRAYDPITNKAKENERVLTALLTPKFYTPLKNLFKGIEEGASASKLAQGLHSNFLIPIQRALTKHKKEILLKVPESLKLGPNITDDILKILDKHFIEGEFEEEYNSYRKLKDARNSLAALIPILQNKVRVNTVVGGLAGYADLISFLVLGIFVELLDPNVLPTDYVPKPPSQEDKDKEELKSFIQTILESMQEESLDFTDQKIREIIEQRSEEDRQTILGRIKKLPDSMKSIELTKKKLGMGDWAVGGTKAIYTYNEDQYVRERTQREQANKGEDEVNDEEPIDEEALGEEDEYEMDAGYDVIDTEDHEDGADADENAGGLSC